MDPRLSPVPIGRPSFLSLPRCGDLAALEADVAILGVPYGVPYDMETSRAVWSLAPSAIREQSVRLVRFLPNFDFDFGGDVFAGRAVRIVDCGDVWMVPGDYDGNQARTTAVVHAVLEHGAVPVVIGGDHSITIPVMRAYEGRGDMCAVQIDAHIDWRDELNGIQNGLSSPMRRASELTCVKGMAQLGIRGVGSARQQDVHDARAYGSVLIGSEEIQGSGVEAALRRIPACARYYITFDADAIDPSLAPGVRSITHGGLSYWQASSLIHGLAKKGRIIGFDFVEVAPPFDVQNLTSFLAARLILNLIGALAHEGQIGAG